MGSATREPRRLRSRAATVLAAALVLGALGVLAVVLRASSGGGVHRFDELPQGAAGRPTYHVGGPGCSDGRTAEAALQAATPWCTPERALEAAPAGAVVVVAPGRYPKLTADGRDEEVPALSFRARRGAARPVLAGVSLTGVAGMTVQGFDIAGGAGIVQSSRVRFADNRLTSRGIYIKSSRHVDVVGNTVEHLQGTPRGLLAQGSGDPTQPGNVDLLISRNTFRDIDHDAIAVYNSHSDVRITDNVIRDIHEPPDFVYHTDAMQLMGGADVLVAGNVVTDVTHGILVKDGVASSGLVVRGNLIAHTPGAALQLFNAPGTLVEHNTIWDSAYGLILDDDDAIAGRTTVDLRDNVIDQLLVQAPGSVASASGNVFGRPAPDAAWGTTGRPPFVDAAAGDYRLRGGGATPPGAQRRVP